MICLMGSFPLLNCLPMISLFSIVQDLNESAKYLNLDLSVILQWACQWKMLFNPDPKNPAQEVIFSKKKMKKAILVSFTTMLKFLVQILKSTWV